MIEGPKLTYFKIGKQNPQNSKNKGIKIIIKPET